MRSSTKSLGKIRLFRITASTTWYDPVHGRREFEMHLKVARRGSIRRNRRALGRRGASYLQRYVYRKYGFWIPMHTIRAHFEREQHASKVEKEISVTPRGMTFLGKHWEAEPLPSTRIPLRARRNELGLPSGLVKMLNDAHQRQEAVEAKRKRIMAQWAKVLREDAKETRKSSK